MTSAAAGWPRPQRVRLAHVEWVEERMTARDWAILEAVNQVRLLRSTQLERLFFATGGNPRSQAVSRGRVLRRLVGWRVLMTLPRRVGGAGHGSASTVLALDSTGQRLLTRRQAATGAARVRYAGLPGERTVQHTLAVAELYVGLVEQTRDSGVAMPAFEAEPGAWWPNGLGGYLQPDAYAVLDSGHVREHWWIEVDRATESLPTLRRKALVYLDFYRRGQLGPSGVMPRVLFSVPDEQRREALVHTLTGLPEPAHDLFAVTTDRATILHLLSSLKE